MAGEENELRSERFKSQVTWVLTDHCSLNGMEIQLLKGFEQRSNII